MPPRDDGPEMVFVIVTANLPSNQFGKLVYALRLKSTQTYQTKAMIAIQASHPRHNIPAQDRFRRSEPSDQETRESDENPLARHISETVRPHCFAAAHNPGHIILISVARTPRRSKLTLIRLSFYEMSFLLPGIRLYEQKACLLCAFIGNIYVMNKTLSAMVAVATLCLASQASASTIDFSTAGTGVAGATGLGGVTYTTSATYGTTPFPTASAAGTVNTTQHGLGMGFTGDTLPTRLDGAIGTWEMVTVTFSAAVNLVDFILGRMDTNDDFEFSINGGAFTYVAPPLAGSISNVPLTLTSNPLNQLVTYAIGSWTNVTSFSIRATGDMSSHSDGSVGTTAGNDDFTLAAANVTAIAPVPLPAGAPLLLAGLAGLAALRRRKRAA